MSRLFTVALFLPLATPVFAATPAEVAKTYADIGAAVFGDTLITGQALQKAVDALLAAPSDETLNAARAAWIAARVPYSQTEVFRFSNTVVDDWEGKVNSWPLDEGLIDYVDVGYGGPTEENPLAALNVIGTPKFELSGTPVDATVITPDLIANTLQAAGGVDANVASGYHAVEFLLWGQDLNGTGPGAGARPFTDYLQGDGCTGGNCDRRAAYLKAATDLLVTDLQYISEAWAEGGAARAVVQTDPQAGLRGILVAMGSLSYGELAGERMKLGLMLNDPEEEQDCFSDNTYNEHYYDAFGIRNVWNGSYSRTDGSVVSGPSLAELVTATDAGLGAQLGGEIDASVAAMAAMKAKAEGGMAYDMMLAPGNAEGGALIAAGVDALVAQTKSIERAATALGLSGATIEGSDSLDNPNAVFQ